MLSRIVRRHFQSMCHQSSHISNEIISANTLVSVCVRVCAQMCVCVCECVFCCRPRNKRSRRIFPINQFVCFAWERLNNAGALSTMPRRGPLSNRMGHFLCGAPLPSPLIEFTKCTHTHKQPPHPIPTHTAL